MFRKIDGEEETKEETTEEKTTEQFPARPLNWGFCLTQPFTRGIFTG